MYDIVIDEHVGAVVVPDQVLHYLRLPKLPKKYKQHPKVATKYNVTPSTSLLTFVAAKAKRVAQHAVPFVVVGQQHYNIDDLTKTQKAYVIECNKKKNKIDAKVFTNLKTLDDSDDDSDDDDDDSDESSDEE